MANPSNFEITHVAAPTGYTKFKIQKLYLHRVDVGAEKNHEALVYRNFGFGHTIVNKWAIYDGTGNDAKLVAHALGLHLNADKSWYHSFSMLFENERFKGSILHVAGVPHDEGEWAIVGGTGEFTMASGVIHRKLHERRSDRILDELTIQGFCPLFEESQVTPTVDPNIDDGDEVVTMTTRAAGFAAGAI